MTDVISVPGRIRAVVLSQHPSGDEVRSRLADLQLREAHVEVVGGRPGWTQSDVERLTSGRVDYLLFASGDPARFDEAVVADALRVLRDDLTTAAVGPSVTGSPTGSLELAASGELLLVRADAFRALDGFEGAVDGVLDDLDLCWRLWLAGHRVRTIAAGPWSLRGGEAQIGERREALLRTLATVLEDDGIRGPGWAVPAPATSLAAVGRRRSSLRSQRRRGDGELLPLAHRWVEEWARCSPVGADAGAVLTELGCPDRAGTRRRVLVVTSDVLAPSMAGPAIRAVAIARALSVEHEVVLATTKSCDLEVSGLEALYADEVTLERLGAWCDVIVFQGWVMAGRSWLRDSHKVVVADLYDPMHLEQLEQGREAEGERGRVNAVRGAAATLNQQMRRADFMLCASTKQRDLWLGALAALGRINPISYDDDPSLTALISLAPFGVSDDPFPSGPGAIKGRVPGIGASDRVVLWGGGVYNWFDPLTLVRAIDRVRARVPDVRLFFLGLTHPNPDVPAMRMAHELRVLAQELGLVGSHVFFNEGWVDYDDRAAFLRDADVGVSTHLDHVETEFSFRTRILDYLWAGLPIVATGGDSFAALIETRGAGVTVPAGDADALEEALAGMLLDPDRTARARAGSKALARELTWSENLEPLLAFCRNPRRAPDVACPTLAASPDGAEMRRGLRRDVDVAVAYLRAGGVRALWSRVRGRLARQMGERLRSPARPRSSSTNH